ncbi:NADPH-dependent FMN reductase [Natronobacterium gregoryi]|uniref:Flavoprotein n=2 Tax=Natronobacterium gregoryi TaxID=44930 RepID=L0AM60_NATGS|nr:NAD(P)H-dependent oxidoreductase [Natronobacterium gregoryi]AFZ74881.1 putative flavoprotein [Natronobacterium gregoryi SP2]ELY73299.1 NADPH-dependent FMN reductase [Natronobacterium gregoryi SP2]PLK19300.1 NADPH-dependent oxidoreductase [Natronobacterium gregoryi SP2]SFJ53136.1 NAD(P)H-dependent FMN reductase [Natronobacterium gregoryi]
MSDVHVVAISGSLREASKTRIALERLLEASQQAGATTELIDLREYDLPTFDADCDREEAGDADLLAERVREADAVVLGSPMYHGSYSSPLKTALDYCGFDEFEGKTVGLLAVSGGAFPVLALEHLRSVCRALNAWVIPHEAAIPNSGSAFEDGSFVDEKLEQRVVTLGRRAVQYANIEPEPDSFESDQNVGAEGK